MPTDLENPFVGPRPLDRLDAIYGRDQEIRELQWFFTAERIVWLHSPSGAGKTSLVQAGLIRRLESDNFEVLPAIRVNGPRVSGFNRYEASALACLKTNSTTLRDYLAGSATAQSRTLIFDQFEEVLTLDPTDVLEKEAFFKSLGKALELPDVWALFVIREDYLPALHPYVCFIPTMMNHRFRLDLLPIANARDAMEKIADKGGRILTEEASQKLGKELSVVRVASSGEWKEGPSIEPVILQVVCRSMWDDLPADIRTIEVNDTPSAAKLEKSLSTYYSNCVKAVANSTGEERTIREWIGEKLIVAGIRNQVLESRDFVAGLSATLVRNLVKTHLIRPDTRRERNWYELAHDRLIEPVLADNQRWMQENLHWVQRRADLWRAQNKTKAVLLSDEELEDAEQWIKRDHPSLTPSEQEFLSQSHEERKVRKQIRTRTRLAWIFAGTMTLATLAAYASYRGASAREYINLARKEVRESEEQFGCAIQHGLKALDLAEFLGADQQRSAMEALSETLQAASPHQQVDPSGLTLALHSSTSRLAVTSGAQVTLFRVPNALVADPIILSRWTLAGDCSATRVSFSPDGTRIVFGLSTGATANFAVRDPGKIECSKPAPTSAAVEALAFSRTGALAWAAGSAGIQIDGRTIALDAQALAFHPDGDLLAAGLSDGTVRILDRSGNQTAMLRHGTTPVTSVAWGPGVLAAASRHQDTLRLWEGPARVLRNEVHTSSPDVGIAGVAVSPDGSRVASIGGGEDHQIKVWQTASHSPPLVLQTPPAKEAALTDVVFFDNAHILVADSNGSVRMYPLESKGLRERAAVFLSQSPCPRWP